MSKAKPVCALCQQPIFLGVQHVCPAAARQGSGPGATNFLKMFAPFAGILVLQLGGAIWWASGVQRDIQSFQDRLVQQEAYFKEQLANHKAIVDRLDSYFRRPVPLQ